jgi:transcriptional regulator with XRE-family HTH domain
MGKYNGRGAAAGARLSFATGVRIATMKTTKAKTGKLTLGRLLHNLRSRNGWTLKEMSRRTGIPLSTLAKVEHDRLTLSYDKLQQLSERLKIPLSELFANAPAEAEAPVTARRSIGRLDRAVRVKTPNYDYFFLCAELRRKRMIPVLTRIRAKSVGEFGELVHHAGEEYIYVLEGRVEIHTEFYDPIVLDAGESIYIDSNMGHAYVAAEGCEEATVLGICSSAEEGLMESLLELHGDEHAAAATTAEGTRAAPSARAKRRRKSSAHADSKKATDNR